MVCREGEESMEGKEIGKWKYLIILFSPKRKSVEWCNKQEYVLPMPAVIEVLKLRQGDKNILYNLNFVTINFIQCSIVENLQKNIVNMTYVVLLFAYLFLSKLDIIVVEC